MENNSKIMIRWTRTFKQSVQYTKKSIIPAGLVSTMPIGGDFVQKSLLKSLWVKFPSAFYQYYELDPHVFGQIYKSARIIGSDLQQFKVRVKHHAKSYDWWVAIDNIEEVYLNQKK